MWLVVFDVDGTLVDSQAAIVAAMGAAFAAEDMAPPPRSEVLGIVGLSLEQAMFRLAPELAADRRLALVGRYKAAYHAARVSGQSAGALYPGIGGLLETLAGLPGVVLGVATGKSRRGLTALLDEHGLSGHFVTTQVADDHPSKPHPSMLRTAMEETGIAPGATVMIGDTTFDMEMARAAGAGAIGVGWGYHPAERLHPLADRVVADAGALGQAIAALAEVRA